MYGCSSSGEYEGEEQVGDEKEILAKSYNTSAQKILKVAKEEQQNEMYSRHSDTTFLYWLSNRLIILNNSSKCNIFTLNVLHKAGFKCPNENILTYDLMDTNRFNNIFPVIKINSHKDIFKGDLIVWYGHVIIFESLVSIGDILYALGWWAGTKQENNGENIINDVVHGKYPLHGEYIIRRPLRKLSEQ